MISLNEISFKYDEKIILEKFSYFFEKEKITCILGSSGCGKSTILKILGGIEKIYSGSVESNSDEIAIIFQHLALFPWMNVFDNIALPLKIKKTKKEIINKRVNKFLKLVKLNGYEKEYIHKLSGGMKQRVAIARVLSTNHKIILMDEPFSALDEITRDKLQIELLKLKKEFNLTIIFVTHNITEAIKLGEKIILLSDSNPTYLKKEFNIDRLKLESDNTYLFKKYDEIKNEF